MEQVDWVKRTEDKIKSLHDLQPKDRMDALTALTICWWSVHDSQMGWGEWLKNIKFLNKLDQNTLVGFFERFREHAIAFLQFDREATQTIRDLFPLPEQKDDAPILEAGMVV